jgi:hypothetical protein
MARISRRKYRLISEGTNKDSISPILTRDRIAASLASQGCTASDEERYKLSISVQEGVWRPNKDLDNYCKTIMDGINQARILWRDDEQVDDLEAHRVRIAGQILTSIEVVIERLPSPVSLIGTAADRNPTRAER